MAIILAIRSSPDMAQMPTMTADLTPLDAQDVLVGTGQQTFNPRVVGSSPTGAYRVMSQDIADGRTQ